MRNYVLRRCDLRSLHSSVTANAQRRYVGETVENCPDPHTLNPHEAIAVAFMTFPAERWQQYMRYDTTISRDFFKTLDALQKLQRTRERRKPVEQAFQAATSPFLGTYLPEPPLSESGIRSLSQNSSAVTNLNQQKGFTYEPTEEKNVSSIRSRSARQ